ncbi:hypothetical protein PG993_008747 [Apiospora rasikravindrae]|uniref:Uncharacterized protein n=1 Tax=Apiospora rasikravindrae TaxID=990691 RepID=A0ABR1SP78_9PEZI
MITLQIRVMINVSPSIITIVFDSTGVDNRSIDDGLCAVNSAANVDWIIVGADLRSIFHDGFQLDRVLHSLLPPPAILRTQRPSNSPHLLLKPVVREGEVVHLHNDVPQGRDGPEVRAAASQGGQDVRVVRMEHRLVPLDALEPWESDADMPDVPCATAADPLEEDVDLFGAGLPGKIEAVLAVEDGASFGMDCLVRAEKRDGDPAIRPAPLGQGLEGFQGKKALLIYLVSDFAGQAKQ